MNRVLIKPGAVALMLLALALAAGCAAGAPAKRAAMDALRDGGPRVVTTFAPLYCFAKNVAGDAAVVENLVPPGASEHTYQARPSDIKKLAGADILVINGVGLEAFLDDLIDAAANPKLTIVDTSKGIAVLDAAEHEGEGHDEAHKSGDPHIWLAPDNAIKQVMAIRDALIDADPAHADTYRRNAAAYRARLERLDAEIARDMRSVEQRPYIVFHNAFQYFERAYGLKNAGAVEEFPGKEPSPRYMKALIDRIEGGEVRIIFTEPQFSPKLVATLKRELDLYVGELDPVGSELSAGGYEKMMRGNRDAFLAAFGQGGAR